MCRPIRCRGPPGEGRGGGRSRVCAEGKVVSMDEKVNEGIRKGRDENK